MELDKAVKKFNEGGAKMSVLARLQWPLDSTKLTEPLKVLKNYNDVLHLMLAVLQIVEGRRAAYVDLTVACAQHTNHTFSTSEELQALGNSLQRLTLSNESLAQSNKTLTDILYLQQQSPDGKVNHAHTSTPSSTQTRSLDATEANGSPFISMHALQEPPLLDSAEPVRPYDPMQNHLQRCMDSVQELAKTIACAMNA